VHNITAKISEKITFERKQVDDVLGGDEAWANAPATEGATRHYAVRWRYHRLKRAMCSTLLEVLRRPSFLHADADPIRRRANDFVFPMRQLILLPHMAGELRDCTYQAG
jgi:hypothetical protein